MKSKNYEAIIEDDEEDRLFVGRVINFKIVIVYYELSVDEIEQSFHNVIDEYLTDWEALNKTPDQPFKSEFNLHKK